MAFDKRNVPSLFTVLNLLCGLLSIIQSIGENFHAAAWFVILAVLCDGMDGKLARLTHTETRLGFEMDSLADAVSFGVAPAILLYRWAFQDFHVLGFVTIFLYLVAGVYRLARFNVIQAGDRSQGYIGLPIPIAAMTLAAYYLFDDRFHLGRPAALLIFLCGLFTVVMVSGIPYDWPKLMYHGTGLQKLQSTILLGIVFLMALVPGVILFPALFLYVIHGIFRAVAAWIRGDVTAGELIHPVKTS